MIELAKQLAMMCAMLIMGFVAMLLLVKALTFIGGLLG